MKKWITVLCICVLVAVHFMSNETHSTTNKGIDTAAPNANLWSQISDCGESEFDNSACKTSRSQQPEQIFSTDEAPESRLFSRGR